MRCLDLHEEGHASPAREVGAIVGASDVAGGDDGGVHVQVRDNNNNNNHVAVDATDMNQSKSGAVLGASDDPNFVSHRSSVLSLMNPVLGEGRSDEGRRGSCDAADAENNLPTKSNKIDPPRLVARDLPYCQSSNEIRIKHNQSFWRIGKLVKHDWFHVLLRRPLYQSVLTLLSSWTLNIIIFAGLYMWAGT